LIYPSAYDLAWRTIRASRKGHRPLSDPYLWHDVYRRYNEAVCRVHHEIVQAHLGIVEAIAQKATCQRFPMPFTNLGKKNALDGQLDIIHEVMGLGNLGLLAAVEHWNPELGKFSTIANFWIRKFIREGTKDIFGIEGLVSPLYLPKRHMALFTVGLTGTKSVHRSDDDGGDYEIDLLDSEGRTSRKYLQRHIGEGGARFLWCVHASSYLGTQVMRHLET
jgi:hypothetical protein